MKTYQDFCQTITRQLFDIIYAQGSLLQWHKSIAGNTKQLQAETEKPYSDTEAEDLIIQKALNILDSRLKSKGVCVNSPQVIVDFLRLNLEQKEQEQFGIFFLDNKSRLIRVLWKNPHFCRI